MVSNEVEDVAETALRAQGGKVVKYEVWICVIRRHPHYVMLHTSGECASRCGGGLFFSLLIPNHEQVPKYPLTTSKELKPLQTSASTCQQVSTEVLSSEVANLVNSSNSRSLLE